MILILSSKLVVCLVVLRSALRGEIKDSLLSLVHAHVFMITIQSKRRSFNWKVFLDPFTPLAKVVS
jgi:hypothetical protein